MRVLLLGAGASKSYGDSPTGQRMPVANDFFQTFQMLDIAAHPWVLREGLIHYLEHEKGIRDTDAYLNSGTDIEALHSEIANRLSDVASDQDKIDRIFLSKAFNELIFLFSATLNTIANGPVSASHIALANWLSPEDVVVTFNWDTLMERALRDTRSWSVDYGYTVKPYSIFRDEWGAPSLQVQSSPLIIKLHGSTNWLTGHPIYEGEELELTHGLPRDTVCIFDYATRPYATFAGRYMGGFGPLTYGYYPPNLTTVPGREAREGRKLVSARPKFPWRPEGLSGDSGVPSMPLIIPPVRNKSYGYFGSLFTDLWAKAEEVLSLCDEILVVGYSFPHTDLQSFTLFRNAFLKRADFPHVIIVDPAPTRPAEVFRRDLGIPDGFLTVLAETFEGESTLKKAQQMRS